MSTPACVCDGTRVHVRTYNGILVEAESQFHQGGSVGEHSQSVGRESQQISLGPGQSATGCGGRLGACTHGEHPVASRVISEDLNGPGSKHRKTHMHEVRLDGRQIAIDSRNTHREPSSLLRHNGLWKQVGSKPTSEWGEQSDPTVHPRKRSTWFLG